MTKTGIFRKLCLAAFAASLLVGSPTTGSTQPYPAAKVRVADKGLAERQLLETLRQLTEQDPQQLATRVDVMIAAYTLVNYIESGDSRLEGRMAAVDSAFAAYQQAAAGGSRPTEGAMTEAFRLQLDQAFAQLGARPEIQDLDRRTESLERRLESLEAEVVELAARPSGGPSTKQRALAVGGMALTIASAVLLAR